MSNFLIRTLAQKAAAHPSVENAVMGAIRDTLPGVIESLLREQYGGENIKLYVAKKGSTERKNRDGLIRARYNGTNADQLAGQFDLSASQVRRIATGSR